MYMYFLFIVDVIHTSCLVSHIKTFPSHTAPAGYVCPGCSTSVRFSSKTTDLCANLSFKTTDLCANLRAFDMKSCWESERRD